MTETTQERPSRRFAAQRSLQVRRLFPPRVSTVWITLRRDETAGDDAAGA